MRRLYLIGGLPGTGKTSLATMICQWFNAQKPSTAVHFENDQYFMDEAGNYKWFPEGMPKAWLECQELTEENMKRGTPVVVVSNTFTQLREREPYLEMARNHGYDVTWIPMTSPFLSVEELTERSLHGVPVETVARMQARWTP